MSKTASDVLVSLERVSGKITLGTVEARARAWPGPPHPWLHRPRRSGHGFRCVPCRTFATEGTVSHSPARVHHRQSGVSFMRNRLNVVGGKLVVRLATGRL
jgi:hypothetical protein